MSFVTWAATQVEDLLFRLSETSESDLLEDPAVQEHVAALYRSIFKRTYRLEFPTPAAGRQYRADVERTGLIDTLAEAAAAQLWRVGRMAVDVLQWVQRAASTLVKCHHCCQCCHAGIRTRVCTAVATPIIQTNEATAAV
jgi:hypothetical protein